MLKEIMEEKFNRLTHPKTIEDFGLRMTAIELKQFPKGEEILEDIKFYTEEKERFNNITRYLSEQMKKTIDKLAMETILGKSEKFHGWVND